MERSRRGERKDTIKIRKEGRDGGEREKGLEKKKEESYSKMMTKDR